MNNLKTDIEAPKSPCIRHCCLDEHDTCLGCFRTLAEILAWHNSTPEQKNQIIIACQIRNKLGDKK